MVSYPLKKTCSVAYVLHPNRDTRDLEVCDRLLRKCPPNYRNRTVKEGERDHLLSKWESGDRRKTMLIKKRGAYCERCNNVQGTGKQFLQVHHRNKDPEDNRPENLHLLCEKCHDEVHKTKDPAFLDVDN